MKKLIFCFLITFFLNSNAHSFLKNNTTAKLEECIFKMDLDESTNQNSDNNISKKNKIEVEEWSYIS